MSPCAFMVVWMKIYLDKFWVYSSIINWISYVVGRKWSFDLHVLFHGLDLVNLSVTPLVLLEEKLIWQVIILLDCFYPCLLMVSTTVI